MFRKKHIKVCSKCSGFEIKYLDGIIGKKNCSVGCIGACKKDRNMYYGKINGHIVECSTKEELFSHMQNALN